MPEVDDEVSAIRKVITDHRLVVADCGFQMNFYSGFLGNGKTFVEEGEGQVQGRVAYV